MKISDDAEHTRALARIEEILGCPEATLEAKELTDLALAVEAYEEERWPIQPPTPEEALAFRREQEAKDPQSVVIQHHPV
jgi:HTH-type transcriptional regulator/antitoxin HigA